MHKMLEELKKWVQKYFDNKGKSVFESDRRFVYQIKNGTNAYCISAHFDPEEDEKHASMCVTKIFKPCHVDSDGFWTPWEDGPAGKVIFDDYVDKNKWKSALGLIARHEMEYFETVKENN